MQINMPLKHQSLILCFMCVYMRIPYSNKEIGTHNNELLLINIIKMQFNKYEDRIYG